MARRQRKAQVGVVSHADSLHHFVQRHLAWMREKNYSEQTIESRAAQLRYFVIWCDDRGLTAPREITKPILERYQHYLFLHRKANGEPLSTRTQHTRIGVIRALFKWLARNNYILYNPASDLDLPRLEKRLPKHVLTLSEVETVLKQPDVGTATGIRDRAMLETFYSTGMRRMELMNLKVFDIDADRGTVMIRQGKGRKDRMIPIGERALRWIEKYQVEVRAELSLGEDDGTLFLSHLGAAFTPSRLTHLAGSYVKKSGINKQGSCHLFRHTMATLMLENGADIRFIQAMLGHVSLDTTQIYTQVSIRMLKQIHTATHPAKAERTDQANPATGADEVEEELLSTLAQEAVEENDLDV